MNVISLLTPKTNVAWLYEDWTIRQGLEKAENLLLEPWYRARSFTICHNDKLTDELFSRDIVERLRQDFTFLLPYYDYFVTLEGDPDPRDAAPV